MQENGRPKAERRTGGVTRRQILRGAAAGVAAFTAAPFFVNSRLYATHGTYVSEHVVLLMYSGGVRTYDTWDLRDRNIPRQWALRTDGVLHREVEAATNGHRSAKIANMCGALRRAYNRRNPRNEKPTIYEYVRKQLDVPASECWHVAESADQNLFLNYSTHRDYGARYGANFISPDAFRTEFRDALRRLGDLRDLDATQQSRVGLVQGAMDQSLLAGAAELPIGNTDRERARITAFLLERAATGYSGTNDQRALRIAKDVITEFQPRVLGITLNTHDVGHGSFTDYIARLKESDAIVGELWDTIQAPGNPMRDKTTVLIVPECGRDEELNEQGGLDHSFGTDASTRFMALLALGPDIKQGVDLTDTETGLRALQVVPTLAKLLGADTPHVDSGVGPMNGLLI